MLAEENVLVVLAKELEMVVLEQQTPEVVELVGMAAQQQMVVQAVQA